MAGHSKWANIKRQKARVDAVRGKTFTQLSRAIIVAARNGIPDPENVGAGIVPTTERHRCVVLCIFICVVSST